MYQDILYEVDDPVAVITLNRPDSLNAWTDRLGAELHDAIHNAAADPAVVGIIITGAGRAFCAGADMKTLQSLTDGSDTAIAQDSRDSTATPPADDFDGRVIYPMAIAKPIIAAVNGAVAGMAYPFALSCDLRVVSPDALFLTAFAQRGLIAEWGLGWLLPRLVGPAVAMDLLMSSRRVDGAEALQLGLANYLTDADDLLPFCRRYIERLASTVSPTSIAVMKRQVYGDFHRGLAASEREARALMVESFDRPDFREGVLSFVEKREPNFDRIGD